MRIYLEFHFYSISDIVFDHLIYHYIFAKFHPLSKNVISQQWDSPLSNYTKFHRVTVGKIFKFIPFSKSWEGYNKI